MLWYDYAVVKFNHLFESIDDIGLTQKLDASLRLWLNSYIYVYINISHIYIYI